MSSRERATAISDGARATTALLLVYLALTCAAGCSKSKARAEEPPEEPKAEVVLVRLGPLTSEHPLYDRYTDLAARQTRLDAPPEMRELTEFLRRPLGRDLRALGGPEITLPGALATWEGEADARLQAGLDEAEALLVEWPQPRDRKAERWVEQEAAQAELDIRNQAALDVVRAEAKALERRTGELAELRQIVETGAPEEAAAAADREARIWRDVAAEADAVRRQADADVARVRQEYRERVTADDEDRAARVAATRATHKALLEGSAGAARRGLPAGVEAAMRPVEPAGNLTETPATADAEGAVGLAEEMRLAQSEALERRRTKLLGARQRLLRQMADGTRLAVRAVAARNDVDVRFVEAPDDDVPDATEQFRSLLRDYWAARRPVRETS